MGRNIEITNEDLIDYLWDYAAENREVPTAKAFRESDEYPSVTLYAKRYGQFVTAVRLAGFRARPGAGRDYWDVELVVGAIRAWVLVHKRLPHQGDLKEDSLLPSPKVVEKYAGGVEEAWSQTTPPKEFAFE